ncbi:hypothetical protein TEK04_05500 [Klenkia sp. LSe6-5]|uniref:Uncharacterized protein n=1 Tax=Klenkia sesuvii TaxID=3103137 RepID=A0ABU8DQQ7_9ACTN
MIEVVRDAGTRNHWHGVGDVRSFLSRHRIVLPGDTGFMDTEVGSVGAGR